MLFDYFYIVEETRIVKSRAADNAYFSHKKLLPLDFIHHLRFSYCFESYEIILRCSCLCVGAIPPWRDGCPVLGRRKACPYGASSEAGGSFLVFSGRLCQVKIVGRKDSQKKCCIKAQMLILERFINILHIRAINSAGECRPHTAEVTGSNPVSPIFQIVSGRI